MKVLLFFLLTFPFLAVAAESSFISRGGGFYCYQEYSDALVNAQTNAELNAQKECGDRKATRISEFEHLRAV